MELEEVNNFLSQELGMVKDKLLAVEECKELLKNQLNVNIRLDYCRP